MEFRRFYPSDTLKPYIRYYYIFESDSNIEFDDTVFPSGDMEMIFNLGEGRWESKIDDKFFATPPVELWGQITRPLAIRSKGRHTMLGIRFLTHAASCFLDDEIGQFNDQVANGFDILGSPVKTLYSQLLETQTPTGRIALIEKFLLERLSGVGRRSIGIDRLAGIVTSLRHHSTETSIHNIASEHGMTARNLQKIIYQHTGLSPKSYNKITRFQHSLRLITKNDQPLTSIAYDCGYFDQSHFIREFRAFTGLTPSAYLENKFPVNQVFLQ
jgi:AraC-like DNA-binding protein